MTAFGTRVDDAPDYTALFRLVKEAVQTRLGKSRAGLMLGLSRMGLAPNGFMGGYFVLGSNAIVLNRDVLDYVRIEAPMHHNAYAFHVLLHEYLHTLGYISEGDVRPLAYEISVAVLGDHHPSTVIAQGMMPGAKTGDGPEFLKQLIYPPFGWQPRHDVPMEIIKGFDPDSTPYIG